MGDISSNAGVAQTAAGGLKNAGSAIEDGNIVEAAKTNLNVKSNAITAYQDVVACASSYRAVLTADADHISSLGEAFDNLDQQLATSIQGNF